MAPVTDLTWQQLAVASNGNWFGQFNISPITEGPQDLRWFLDIGAVLGETQLKDLNSPGVIKALTRLLDAARIAQEKANEGKVAGERLTAFPAPTTGAPANGAVPITRTIAARALLSSATQIVGTNA